MSQAVQILEKCLLVVTALLWLENSPPSAARSVMSTFGIVYAWEATQMIVAHMTKEPIVTTWWPTAMMALAYLNTHLAALDPALIPFLINIAVVAGYLHYVTSVVNEICAFLDINCLTIKHKASKA
jgi:ethanolaminephosphotransferase